MASKAQMASEAQPQNATARKPPTIGDKPVAFSAIEVSFATRPKSVLVTTVGGAPQVVTIVLDELIRREQLFEEVVIVHTSERNPQIAQALAALRHEQNNYEARRPPVRFRFVAFRDENGEVPEDVLTLEDAQAVLNSLYHELMALKDRGYTVHLSIAGGRKIISAFGTCAAQYHFDEGDVCWHLISEEKLLQSGRMHALPSEEVHLVPVPILRWKATPPVATALAMARDPFEAQRLQTALSGNERMKQMRDFLEGRANPALTIAESEMLCELARKGSNDAELAAAFRISPSTAATRVSSLCAKYELWLKSRREERRVHRGHLIADFGQIVVAIDNEKAALSARKQLPNS